jgi:hypothetical protein
MNQNHGLALAHNDVSDLDTIGAEELISGLRVRRTGKEKAYYGT